MKQYLLFSKWPTKLVAIFVDLFIWQVKVFKLIFIQQAPLEIGLAINSSSFFTNQINLIRLFKLFYFAEHLIYLLKKILNFFWPQQEL